VLLVNHREKASLPKSDREMKGTSYDSDNDDKPGPVSRTEHSRDSRTANDPAQWRGTCLYGSREWNTHWGHSRRQKSQLQISSWNSKIYICDRNVRTFFPFVSEKRYLSHTMLEGLVKILRSTKQGRHEGQEERHDSWWSQRRELIHVSGINPAYPSKLSTPRGILHIIST